MHGVPSCELIDQILAQDGIRAGLAGCRYGNRRGVAHDAIGFHRDRHIATLYSGRDLKRDLVQPWKVGRPSRIIRSHRGSPDVYRRAPQIAHWRLVRIVSMNGSEARAQIGRASWRERVSKAAIASRRK